MTIRWTIRCVALLAALLLADPSTLRAQSKENTGDSQQKTKKLGQRLIRSGTEEESDGIMGDIIRSMELSARRLELDFDAGQDTQILQSGIVDQLDEAIKIAAAQRRLSRQAQPSSSSDRRKQKKPEASRSEVDSSKQGIAKSDATSAAQDPSGSGTPEHGPRGGRIDEIRRTWGHLPARERDEIIQGISESFLERYREWIERYYRALQESDQ